MVAWHLFRQWSNLNCPMSISSPRWTLWRTKGISRSAFLFQHPWLSCLFEFFGDLIILSVICCSYLNPEAQILLSGLNQHMAPQFAKLNKALAELVSYREDMNHLHSFIFYKMNYGVNNCYRCTWIYFVLSLMYTWLGICDHPNTITHFWFRRFE